MMEKYGEIAYVSGFVNDMVESNDRFNLGYDK